MDKIDKEEAAAAEKYKDSDIKTLRCKLRVKRTIKEKMVSLPLISIDNNLSSDWMMHK